MDHMFLILTKILAFEQVSGQKLVMGAYFPDLVFEPNPTKFPVNETIIDRTTIVFNSKEAKSYENHLIRYKHIMKGQRSKSFGCGDEK